MRLLTCVLIVLTASAAGAADRTTRSIKSPWVRVPGAIYYPSGTDLAKHVCSGLLLATPAMLNWKPNDGTDCAGYSEVTIRWALVDNVWMRRTFTSDPKNFWDTVMVDEIGGRRHTFNGIEISLLEIARIVVRHTDIEITCMVNEGEPCPIAALEGESTSSEP